MSNRRDTRTVNLSDLISLITEIKNIEEIYLFGSRAYNTGSLRSDIDILVYAPEGVRADEINRIIEKENALDIFETTNKVEARSFANDSRLKRQNLIKTIDAKLLWSRENGYNDEILSQYKEIKLLIDYDYKMSIMPSYSKEEESFYKEYGHFAVFIIMPFAPEYNNIDQAIKKIFKDCGYTAVRADEKYFSADLWENVRVYLECCDTAVAVFDKNDQDNYNPNVALEVGYMMAKGSKVSSVS